MARRAPVSGLLPAALPAIILNLVLPQDGAA